RQHEVVARRVDAPVLFPGNLLDGVRPGQGEPFDRQRRHDGRCHGKAQSQAHRVLRRQWSSRTRAVAAKPIWSVTGEATTRANAPTSARMLSYQGIDTQRNPTLAAPHRPMAIRAFRTT